MKGAFYPKLALDGIRKNKRLYIPYILTCVGMVTMFYIITFLQKSETVGAMRSGSTVQKILSFGIIVIAVFACIFLFYTNSFLMKRRKKEFGLYNILGMGKRNIGIILVWESLIIALFSLAVGLFIGIAISKLAELALVNILNGAVKYSFSISPLAIVMTVAVFGAIFLLLLLNSIRQIRFSNTAALLRSENLGEKPPKGNIFIGILGILLLGGAYWLAVSIKDPIAAMLMFFIAVIMVILGTYLTMIAGSVSFCRILQKNKKYYYKPSHFVSVSSMAYRMKRNGAGLASVCILATMVLVMISSTASLYFGADDAVKKLYPREINTTVTFRRADAATKENAATVRDEIAKTATENGATVSNISAYRSISFSALARGSDFLTNAEDVYSYSEFNATASGVYWIYIIPLSDFNAMSEYSEKLDKNEVIVSFYGNGRKFENDTLSFNGKQSYHVKDVIASDFERGDAAKNLSQSLIIVSSDPDAIIEDIYAAKDPVNVLFRYTFNFDTGLDADGQIALAQKIAYSDTLSDLSLSEKLGYGSINVESRENNRNDFYCTYGGLFFLGILLSVIFIFAAVLIIYYKQITEGYEDQARFDIMQKIGMTKKEIRKSINSQLLTVFFLPLLFAALHLAFAFPMVKKMLALSGLQNITLFALVTIGTFFVYAIFYALVYKITSNAYYRIVSDAK